MKKILPVLLLFSVAACAGTDVKESLGLKKQPPDEFAVLSRPPLVVPPDFRLPAPGAGGSQFDRDQAREQARSTLIGGKPKSMEGKTAAEQSLLSSAGAQNADPNIRDVLSQEREAAREEKEEKKDGLLGLGGLIDPVMPGEEDPLVDPVAEKKRIEENAKQGKPVNEGEVETIDPMKDGIF